MVSRQERNGVGSLVVACMQVAANQKVTNGSDA